MTDGSKTPCPCTYDCARKGDCVACIDFHRKIGTLTACMEGLESEAATKAKGPGRVLTLADKPHLTAYAACAG